LRSLDFEDPCARHLEFGTSHPRDYELLYGRGWMERVTRDAQGVEIDRFTAHLVRAGVDERRVAHVAYAIMMMLHGVVMHRLSSKTQSLLGQSCQLSVVIPGHENGVICVLGRGDRGAGGQRHGQNVNSPSGSARTRPNGSNLARVRSVSQDLPPAPRATIASREVSVRGSALAWAALGSIASCAAR
jgi:hypothetical protein